MQASHFIGMMQFGACHKETSAGKLPKPLGKGLSKDIEHPRSSKHSGRSQLPNAKVFSAREVPGNLLIALRGNKNVMES